MVHLHLSDETYSGELITGSRPTFSSLRFMERSIGSCTTASQLLHEWKQSSLDYFGALASSCVRSTFAHLKETCSMFQSFNNLWTHTLTQIEVGQISLHKSQDMWLIELESCVIPIYLSSGCFLVGTTYFSGQRVGTMGHSTSSIAISLVLPPYKLLRTQSLILGNIKWASRTLRSFHCVHLLIVAKKRVTTLRHCLKHGLLWESL
jgi:hypothetical protein